MILNSLTGTDGSPVSSINCDMTLHSGIRALSVMSVGRQITDGYGLCTKSRPPLSRLCCDQAGMAECNSACTVCLSDVVHIKPKASETYGRVEHCKQTVQGPFNTLHTCPGCRAVSHTIHSQTL